MADRVLLDRYWRPARGFIVRDWWARRPKWQQWTIGVFAAVVVIGSVGNATDDGVTSDDVEVVQGELDATQQRLDQETSSLNAAETERDRLTASVAELQGQLDAAEADRAAVESQVSAQSETLASLEGDIAQIQADLAAAAADLATAVSDVAEAERRVTTLADANQELSASVEEERAARALADANAAAVALAFDPEMAATRSALVKEMDDVICGFHEGIDPTDPLIHQTVRLIIEGSPEYSIAFEGYDLDVVFDLAGLAATVTECQRVKLLTAPKGSGFYTVGDEIAPGKWRSTGTGGGCYWARLDANQNIRDNHFGSAGGTVTIRSSDYEVEFNDCGIWEYLG